MNSLPPPNWYPDPDNQAQWRYWDGQRWTDHYAPRKETNSAAEIDSVTEQIVESVELKAEVAQVEAQSVQPSTGIVSEVHTKITRITSRSRRLSSWKAWQTSPEPLASVVERLQLEPLREWLDEQVEVAGEVHHAKDVRKLFRANDTPITTKGAELDDLLCILVPEPWNPYDKNAVAIVIDGGFHVGYVPAELAVEYAQILGAFASSGVLVTGRARIWAKDEGGGIIRVRATVLVPEASELQGG